jgi:DtxR family Mn-dependent transcriptional regulator
MQNISKEDYLSAIYKYRETDGNIKANRIAEKLSITNAAVTDMLKRLAKDGYVNYKRYQGIKLTAEGEDYAKSMVRRHRIWEVFLHQVVGIPWDKVHEEAHNLEHSASDELINRMEEMLDFPTFDPHGDPIPSKDGVLPEQKKNLPLSLLKAEHKGKVVRVNDFDDGFLNYLSKIGIELGKEIHVKEILEFDHSMLVGVDGKETNLSSKLAANIFVEESEK